MKSTGIVRKVDQLGRIVLPIEMRRTLDIAENYALEKCGGLVRHSEKVQAQLYFLRRYQGHHRVQGQERLPQVPERAQELVTGKVLPHLCMET